MSDVGENWFSVGTRFLLETFHCGLMKRTKERQFGFNHLLVLSIQQCVAQDLHQTSQQRLFNWKGHHCFRFHESKTKEARRQERKLSLGSKHLHQVHSQPRCSLTIPKSWTVWDWLSSTNWALSLGFAQFGKQLSRKCLSNWLPHVAACGIFSLTLTNGCISNFQFSVSNQWPKRASKQIICKQNGQTRMLALFQNFTNSSAFALNCQFVHESEQKRNQVQFWLIKEDQ